MGIDGIQSKEEGDEVKEKKEDEVIHLRRTIGLLPAISFIIGTVVGSGIFIAPKGVLMNSGSVGLSLVVWALCGVLSTFGALCYAELGTTFTKSGGHYTYLLETLGPLPAFLRLWAEFLFIRPAVTSYVSLAFGRYVVHPFSSPCAPPTALIKLVSILGYYTMMTAEELLVSDAVAVTFANRALHGLASAIPVLVAVSCLGALNGGFFGAPRMLFVGAREGHWPVLFSMIHIHQNTPLPVVLLLYPMVVVMVARGEIFQLINFASFSRWLFIAMATMGMLIHRYRFPLHPRPFKVPLAIAVTFTVVCFFIVGLSLYSDPWNTGGSCALTLSGVPVYYLTVHRSHLPTRWRKSFNYCSKQLQILLEVAQQEVQTY
ncbi:cystine/glutamate transporter-like [Oncorhynchus masou masou]|uniref:cystine/glutamate transporter-like n=1 Tax=Oncorhynchus masou masou TaxID=90313 RepID=UPI00318392FF